MLTVRLDDEMEGFLKALSEQTQRPKEIPATRPGQRNIVTKCSNSTPVICGTM